MWPFEMRRRGLFGWFAGAVAVPAAAGGAGGTGSLAEASGPGQPAMLVFDRILSRAECDGILAVWGEPPKGLRRTLRLDPHKASKVAHSGLFKPNERAAVACLSPRAFAAFMRDRLGDQDMIP